MIVRRVRFALALRKIGWLATLHQHGKSVYRLLDGLRLQLAPRARADDGGLALANQKGSAAIKVGHAGGRAIADDQAQRAMPGIEEVGVDDKAGSWFERSPASQAFGFARAIDRAESVMRRINADDDELRQFIAVGRQFAPVQAVVNLLPGRAAASQWVGALWRLSATFAAYCKQPKSQPRQRGTDLISFDSGVTFATAYAIYDPSLCAG